MTPEHNEYHCEKLMAYAKREERERLLGIIEFVKNELGESSYELYAIKVLHKVIDTIETNELGCKSVDNPLNLPEHLI